MIRVQTDPFSIDPVLDWEESDRIVAATLSTETEQRFLELARELRATLMAAPMIGSPEEQAQIRSEATYLRGKYDLLLSLVEESKEAKVQQHLV